MFTSSAAFVIAVPDDVMEPDVLKDLVAAHQATAKYSADISGFELTGGARCLENQGQQCEGFVFPLQAQAL